MRLEIKNKSYGDVVILENTEITINNGLTIITGPSGIGKTTLVNILIGRDSKWYGIINWKTIVEKQAYISAMRGNCFFVEQRNHFLNNETVKENITIWCNIFKIDIDYDLLSSLTKTLKIEKLLDREITNLSGGEKQRVALCRALMCKPSFLVLDEPTSSLDDDNKIIVYQAIKNLSQNLPIIMITHDLDSISYADNLLEIKNKKIFCIFGGREANLDTIPRKINFYFLNKLILKENLKTIWMSLLILLFFAICFYVNNIFITEINTTTELYNSTYQTSYEVELALYNDVTNPESFEYLSNNYNFDYAVVTENQIAIFTIPREEIDNFCQDVKLEYSCDTNDYELNKQAEQKLMYLNTIIGITIMCQLFVFVAIIYYNYLFFRKNNFATKTLRQCNLNFKQLTLIFGFKTFWTYFPLSIFIVGGGYFVTLLTILLLSSMWSNYKIYYKGK